MVLRNREAGTNFFFLPQAFYFGIFLLGGFRDGQLGAKEIECLVHVSHSRPLPVARGLLVLCGQGRKLALSHQLLSKHTIQ